MEDVSAVRILSILASWIIKALLFIVQGYIVVRVCRTLWILVQSFYYHILARPLNTEKFKEKWTVVTGCTDGIGLAYIEELARARGFRRFFLIGRNPEKLNNVTATLRDKYTCEVRTHQFDFESTDYQDLGKALELIDDDIGILVNCAGIAAGRVASFSENPTDISSRIIQVNLMATVRLIELILPGMIRRNSGIIVNVSSICGWRPYPYMSAYPASKAGVSFFSSALNDELQGSGVRVQCLLPALVATKMTMYSREEANNVFVLDTRTYARQAVHLLGRVFLTSGSIQHDMQSPAKTY